MKEETNNMNLPEIAGIPIDLYRSMQGRFFAGLAEDLQFGNGTGAWASLTNPVDSGVNLFVWAWAITDVLDTAYRVQIWMNADARDTAHLTQCGTNQYRIHAASGSPGQAGVCFHGSRGPCWRG